jgi:hypothetical protein
MWVASEDEELMFVNDRAAAAPYVQALLYDQEVQEAVRRMATAGHRTYLRARGKSPTTAMKDKRLRRCASQTSVAVWQVLAAIDAAQARPRRRRGRRLVAVLILAGSAYGVYLAANADGARRSAV